MEEKTFQGQRYDETVELLFRRHFIVFLPSILPFLISIYGVLGCIYFNLSSFVFYLAIGITSLFLLFFSYKMMLWYFSYFILTNQRIRCVQRNGIFTQAIVDVSLKSINDTQYQEKGILSLIYGYGDIHIESNSADLLINRTAKAKEVYDLLQNLLIEGEKNETEE